MMRCARGTPGGALAPYVLSMCETPTVAESAPDVAELTAYDIRHSITYLRLLDADNEGADWDEVACGSRVRTKLSPGSPRAGGLWLRADDAGVAHGGLARPARRLPRSGGPRAAVAQGECGMASHALDRRLPALEAALTFMISYSPNLLRTCKMAGRISIEAVAITRHRENRSGP
jgi:hypothetical protein